MVNDMPMIAARGCDDEADSGGAAFVGDGWGTGASGSVSGARAMAPGGCAQHGQGGEGERPFAAREGRLLGRGESWGKRYTIADQSGGMDQQEFCAFRSWLSWAGGICVGGHAS